MKAFEQYFPVVLFVLLHSVVPTFESMTETQQGDHSNETTEQYFPVALFILLYSVALTLESVDETLNCNYSNESY